MLFFLACSKKGTLLDIESQPTITTYYYSSFVNFVKAIDIYIYILKRHRLLIWEALVTKLLRGPKKKPTLRKYNTLGS